MAGSSAEHLETDGLGSLEKLHTIGTMGTMRSIRSNGSIPTLERVRREESNHSIGSHSQASSGQVRTCPVVCKSLSAQQPLYPFCLSV